MNYFGIISVFILVLTIPVYSENETSASNQQKYDFLVEIMYAVEEENVSMMIDYAINDIPRNDIDKYLTLKDFMNFVEMSKITLDEFNDLITTLKIQPYINCHGVNHTVTALNISITEIYNKLISAFKINSSVVYEVCNIFQLDFMKLVGYTFTSNDVLLLGEICKGVYTDTTINMALDLIKINKTELFVFGKEIVLKRLENQTMENMLYCFDAMKVNNAISTIISTLKINVASTTNTKILKLWEQFVEKLAVNEALGVKVRQNNIFSHINVYDTIQKYKSFLYILPFDMSNSDIEIIEVAYEASNTKLKVKKNFETALPIMTDYGAGSLEHCDYFSGHLKYLEKNVTSEHVHNIKNDGKGLIMAKSNITQFRLGSPLICKGQLCGLAKYHTNTTIFFTYASSGNVLSFASYLVVLMLLLTM